MATASIERTFPPHTFSVLHPVGHLPRSPVCLRPARPRARALAPCTSTGRRSPARPWQGPALIFGNWLLLAWRHRQGRRRSPVEEGKARAGRSASARSSGSRGGEESVGDVLRGVGRKKCVAGSTCDHAVLVVVERQHTVPCQACLPLLHPFPHLLNADPPDDLDLRRSLHRASRAGSQLPVVRHFRLHPNHEAVGFGYAFLNDSRMCLLRRRT